MADNPLSHDHQARHDRAQHRRAVAVTMHRGHAALLRRAAEITTGDPQQLLTLAAWHDAEAARSEAAYRRNVGR